MTYQKGSFLHTTFSHKSCHIMTIIQSHKCLQNKLINNNNNNFIHIHFVGDSLGGQILVSLRCEFERLNISNVIITRYFENTFLKNIYSSYHWLHHLPRLSHEYNHTSLSTVINKRNNNNNNYSNNYYYNNNNNYKNRINPLPSIIIFDTGAWYNTTELISKYPDALRQLVVEVGPLAAEGVLLVWLALPPARHSKWPFLNSPCIDFDVKNQIARDILIHNGYLYFDENNALESRLKVDSDVMMEDGVHWRSPAVSSVPSFLARALLHFICLELET